MKTVRWTPEGSLLKSEQIWAECSHRPGGENKLREKLWNLHCTGSQLTKRCGSTAPSASPEGAVLTLSSSQLTESSDEGNWKCNTHQFGPAASFPTRSGLVVVVGSLLGGEEEHPLGCGREGRPNGGEAFGAFGNPAAGRAKDFLGSETKARPVGGELAVRRDDVAKDHLLAVEVPSPRGGAERTRLSVETAARPGDRHRRGANLVGAPRSCSVLPSSLVDVQPASLVELRTAPPGGEAKISPLGGGA